jgi:hypothetical protein
MCVSIIYVIVPFPEKAKWAELKWRGSIECVYFCPTAIAQICPLLHLLTKTDVRLGSYVLMICAHINRDH